MQRRKLLNYPLLPESVLFGVSEAMEGVRQQLGRLLLVSVPVLITGEGGAGKEALARYMHQRSCPGSAPFVKLHCSALTQDFAPLEYEDGRFLKVQVDHELESHRHGTLFLHDVGELNPTHQQTLMQLLQQGKVYFVSQTLQEPIELRIICATDRDLEMAIQEGLFRRDLFHLINIGTIKLPPLRDRAGDIPLIVDFLLAAYQEAFHLEVNPISPAMISTLQQYRWPGNIRQLESVIKRYVVLGTESSIRAELLHSDELLPNLKTKSWQLLSNPSKNGRVSLRTATRDFENQVILRSLEENHWNRRRAARALDISYRALLYKMKGLGLS